MQKKLLALVATVAMVLSMFAGIAFAAEATKINSIVQPTLTGGEEANRQNVNDFMDELWAAGTGVFSYADGTLTVNIDKITAEMLLFIETNWGGNSVPLALVLDGDAPEGLNADANWNNAVLDWIGLDAKDNGTVTRTIPGTVLSYKVDYVGQYGQKYTVQLGTKKYISSGEAPGFQQIIGSITGAKTETSVGDPLKNFVIKYTYDSNDAADVPGTPVIVTNGQFSFYLPTGIPAQDITLNVYEEDGTTLLQSEGKNVTAKIEVRYNVATTPTELKFNKNEPVVVSGTVTDSNGKPVKAKDVDLTATVTPAFPATLKTNDNGEFAFVVYNWAAAGEYQLQINGANHAKVTVAYGAATLTVTPNSGVVRKIANVKFEVKGSGYAETGTVTAELKKGTTKVEGIDFSSITNATFEEGAFKSEFTWNPDEVGTYTLTIKRGDYSASATITVTNPVSYNLINGSKLEELKVGDNKFTFGLNDADIRLVQFKADGNTEHGFYYTVSIDGKVAKIDGTQTDFVKERGTVNIATKKLGSKTIKVVAYASQADDAKAVFEKTFTAKVAGWDVTLDPTELTVKKAQNVVVVVKDAEGNAINNATIVIGDKTIAAGSSNVQNGTYTIKDVKFNLPGNQDVKVYKGAVAEANLMAQLKLAVVGERVYSVTSDVEALLQGKAQDVKLTVTKDGLAVMPQRIKWVYEDGTTGEAYPSYLGDGVSKVEIKATKAGDIVVRAENFDGTLCGETTIEVVAPQLVLIDEEAVNVTENFKSKVHFKVVDPRDGSAIKANLSLTGKYADIEVYDANDGIIVPNDKVVSILGDEEYALTIMATNADYEAAEDDEKVVAVVLKVNDAELDAHFEIKEATISSNPGMIVIGANNNLTITFADANGKPIVGKQMYVGETKLDKTDEDGQIIYPISVATTGVTIKGDTDAKDGDKVIKVEHTIKIGYDAEAPKVTYEVNGDKATLVITDNVRLVRINIDGKEIDFWPGAKYEHKVTLKPGVNKFAVKAQDSNDNVLDEVVEIEYKTDAVVLKDDQVQRQGEFIFVQLRQFEEFGAQVGWKQDTRTATFIVGDTKVEVTIGSTTAMVNGKAVTMPAAPFIANNRTYVPTRFIAEALGWNVHWAAGDIITITLP